MIKDTFDIGRNKGPGTGGRMDQPIGGMRRHQEYLDRLENLYKFDWLKQTLGKAPPLKGDYTFGKEGNVRVQHNLLDELVNRLTEKLYFNRYEDVNPEIKIGTKFGKNKKLYTDLTASPESIGLDLGIKF